MNVLFIAPNVCMDCNTGDVIHVTELANGFSELGHNVFLIARLKKPQRSVFNFQFKFKSIKPIKYNKLWIPYTMVTAFFFTLSLLISKKIDLIYERHHVFGIGVILGKMFRVPTIVEVNGITVEEMKVLKSYNWIIINLARLIESFTLQNATCIVAVTEGIKKYLSENYRIKSDRIINISNSVNTDIFKPIEHCKERLNLDPEFNYILFVGSLVDWQGVDILIKASPLILKNMPKTRFLIVGDGPMKVDWVNLTYKMNTQNNFSFVGSVIYNQVPLYINASDICVAPKKPLESGYSPLKLYEYMACGKPVVASNVLGFETLIDNKAGLLFKPMDEYELSNVILKLLCDKKLRQNLGVNGFRYIQKNHSWRKVAEKLSNIYNSIKYQEINSV